MRACALGCDNANNVPYSSVARDAGQLPAFLYRRVLRPSSAWTIIARPRSPVATVHRFTIVPSLSCTSNVNAGGRSRVAAPRMPLVAVGVGMKLRDSSAPLHADWSGERASPDPIVRTLGSVSNLAVGGGSWSRRAPDARYGRSIQPSSHRALLRTNRCAARCPRHLPPLRQPILATGTFACSLGQRRGIHRSVAAPTATNAITAPTCNVAGRSAVYRRHGSTSVSCGPPVQ